MSEFFTEHPSVVSGSVLMLVTTQRWCRKRVNFSFPGLA